MSNPARDPASPDDARVDFAKYKALIFDVDGTLAETEETHRQSFNDAFAHFKLPWNWDAALYGDLLKVTGGKERMRHFADAYPHTGPAIGDDEIARIHRFKTGRFAEMVATGQCPLRPGVGSLIERAHARGQHLAIATTTSRSNVEALLKSAFGPQGVAMFGVIVAGDEVAAKKPAPDVYLKALEMLNLQGADCVAVEDSHNGLLSAMRAGIPVVVTPSFYSQHDDFSGAMAVLTTL